MAFGDPIKPWKEEVAQGLERAEEFVAGARKGPAQESYIRSKILNWGWFSMWWHMNARFNMPELHIYLKIPFSHGTFWDPAWDCIRTGRLALFLVFGKIPACTPHWHARGGIIHHDISKFSGSKFDRALRVRKATRPVSEWPKQ